MANYRKSFNFRNGVQVDNDKFLVDGRGNVGVGTSTPNRPLDVYGTARVNGLLDTTTLRVSSASTFSSLVTIGNSVFLNPTTGIISAVSYRGDGTLLAGVIAIATDGWVKNAGTLSTSFNIYQGPFTVGVLPVALGPLQVGVGTTAFIVDFGGSVGIGTTIPRNTLDVRGGIGATTLRVSGVSTFLNQVDFGGGTQIISSGEVKLVDLNRIMLGYSGATPNGLVIRNWSAQNKAEIVHVGSGDIEIESGTNREVRIGESVVTDVLCINKNGIRVTTGISTIPNLNVTGVTTSTGFYLNSGTTQLTTGNLNLSGNIYLGSVWLSGRDINFTGEWDGGTNWGNFVFTRRSSFGGFSEVARIVGATGTIVSQGGLQVSGITTLSGITTVSGATLFAKQIDASSVVTFRDDLALYDQNNTVGLLWDQSQSRLELLSGNSLTFGDGVAPQLLVSGITNSESSIYAYNGVPFTIKTSTSASTLGNATTKLSVNDVGIIVTGLTTSNHLNVIGVSTSNRVRTETLGIGTNTFDSDLTIRKDASVAVELISNTGSASIGLGSEALGGNNTARIRYNPLTQVLDIDNNGSGEVNFHVHKGNGAVVGTQTGGFYFKTGSGAKVLMNLAYDGRVSINESVPLLTDLSYSLMVNGNTKIRGRVDLDAGINAGIGTFNNLNVIGISTFSTDQNFNTQSGISTFNQFNVLNRLNVIGITSFIGVTTFLSNVSIGRSISGTNSPFDIYSQTTLRTANLGLGTSKLFYDYVGGITTGFNDPRNQVKLSGLISDPNKKISAFGYGDYQIRTGGLSIICQDYINIHPSLAVTTVGAWEGLSVNENSDMGLRYANGNNLPMIGINTTFARSIIDVGYAVTSMNSYLIVPRLSSTDLYYVSQLWNPNIAGPSAGNWFNHARANSSTPTGVVGGALVFDTTASQLKVGIAATTFCGVATYTNNHSGFSAFVPPTMTTTERNTMTNSGIQSGAIIYNSTSNRLEVRLNNAWFGITTAV